MRRRRRWCRRGAEFTFEHERSSPAFDRGSYESRQFSFYVYLVDVLLLIEEKVIIYVRIQTRKNAVVRYNFSSTY